MAKISKFFEYAYLTLMVFFLYHAYIEWGQEGGKSTLYLCLSGAAVFMFFFKRSFRKRAETNNKNK